MDRFNKVHPSDFYFLLPLILIVVLWTALGKYGIINPVLISSPWAVLRTISDLAATAGPNGYSLLLSHIYYSLNRLIIAFIGATTIGCFIGIIMGTKRLAYKLFDPVITLMMPIPGIAWAPIFMVWFGIGNNSILAAATLAAFFPIVYNVAAGARTINQEYIWAAQTMGAKNSTLFFKVYIPSIAAYLFTGLKLGLARGWKTVIAVEMIAASMWGLGFMIFDAREFLHPSVIYAGIIVLALIYYFIEHVVIKYIEKHTIEKWGMLRNGGI